MKLLQALFLFWVRLGLSGSTAKDLLAPSVPTPLALSSAPLVLSAPAAFQVLLRAPNRVSLQEQWHEKFTTLDPALDFSNVSAWSFDSLVRGFNSSGLLWTFLDLLSQNKTLARHVALWAGQETIAILSPNSLDLGAVLLMINYTDIARSAQISGIINTVLDTLLLDDSVRVILTNLVYENVETYMDFIAFGIHRYLPHLLHKRGSLVLGRPYSMPEPPALVLVQSSGAAPSPTGGPQDLSITIYDATESASLPVETSLASGLAFPVGSSASGQDYSTGISLIMGPAPSTPPESPILPSLNHSTINFPSLSEYLEFASTVVHSQMFSLLVLGFFQSLNNTGVLAYTVTRLVTTPAYVNVGKQFCSDFVDTGALTAIASSDVSLVPLLTGLLASTDMAVDILDAMMTGDVGFLGKYSAPISSMIDDLEKRGMFVDLLQLVYPQSGSPARKAMSVNGVVKDKKVKLGQESVAQGRVSHLIAMSFQVLTLGVVIGF